MKTVLGLGSLAFALVAGWFLYVGFSIETVVPTDGGDVANLQMMHIQSLNVSIGIGAALVSTLLLVGLAIVSAVKQTEEPS